jgi:hypothetical protein
MEHLAQRSVDEPSGQEELPEERCHEGGLCEQHGGEADAQHGERLRAGWRESEA